MWVLDDHKLGKDIHTILAKVIFNWLQAQSFLLERGWGEVWGVILICPKGQAWILHMFKDLLEWASLWLQNLHSATPVGQTHIRKSHKGMNIHTYILTCCHTVWLSSLRATTMDGLLVSQSAGWFDRQTHMHHYINTYITHVHNEHLKSPLCNIFISQRIVIRDLWPYKWTANQQECLHWLIHTKSAVICLYLCTQIDKCRDQMLS